MNFDQRSGQYRSYIESFLRNYCETCADQPQKPLYEAMAYSLLAGGKRLRPVFAFEFCRLCGGDWKTAAPLAAAVEMIHTYSLIHDDLPCMDNDDYRRGRLTNHKVYGEGMAVLAGDALLTDAFQMAATANLPHPEQMATAIGLLAECAGSKGMVGGQVLDIMSALLTDAFQMAATANLPHPEQMATAIGLLAECAGSKGMVGGQVLDIMSQERQLTEQEVLDIQSRKTGGLIRAACCLGILAGGGSQAQLDAARQFADGIGLAFQIRDDMLDVIGTQEELGKATGVDTEKNTFVRLYGLERCEALVQQYTDHALEGLHLFADTQYIRQLAQSLTQRRS